MVPVSKNIEDPDPLREPSKRCGYERIRIHNTTYLVGTVISKTLLGSSWPEDLLWAVFLEDKDPEAAGEEEEDAEHLVERWQGNLPRGQVVVVVLLLDVYCEIDGDPKRRRLKVR